MIYKIDKDKIKIWDFVKNAENNVQFNEQIRISRVSINSSNDKIAVWGGDVGQKDPKLYIIDLPTSKKIYELDVLYDFQWYGSDSLLISDGNAMHQLTFKDGKYRKLIKFSRIKIGPSEISVSHDLSKFAFVKWKNDNKKLCVYDFNSSSILQFKPSLYNYTWLDNEKLVYNYGDGLKILQISDGKSIILLKDINSLIKRAGIQNEYIKDLLNIVRKDDKILNMIEKPVFFNERLYFSVFCANKTEKRIGIASIKNDLSDIRFHFYGTIGLIGGYYIMNNPEIIGVYIYPNKLVGEKFKAEIQYFQDNKKIEFKEYHPILNSYIPTYL
jgi:hypothetical protein